MIFNMQWAALSSLSGVGSNAAMQDSSGMFIQTYNAMIEGFVKQIDTQLGKRLFTWNEFPGMTRRPRLVADPINKLSLGQLSAILGPLAEVLTLGDDDMIAIRKQTGFLPETLPEVEDEPAVPADKAPALDETSGEGEDESAATQDDAESTAETVQQSLIAWKEWARKNNAAEFARLERKV